MGQRWPDCDPDLVEWLSRALDTSSAHLGRGMVGAYLHGSLATGSFYRPKSDVDVLFVVSDPLPPDARETFARACADASAARPIVGGLECSVVLAGAAARPRPPIPFEVHFGEEHAAEIVAGAVDHTQDRVDGDLAGHFQAVREAGVTLRGRPYAEVFGPVDPDDFLASVEADLDWILGGESILESPFYSVLNACRMLWLWSGHSPRLAPSKEEAALWALRAVPSAHRALVARALAAYRDPSPVAPAERARAGRAWDSAELLAFRDWMRGRRPTHRPTAPGV